MVLILGASCGAEVNAAVDMPIATAETKLSAESAESSESAESAASRGGGGGGAREVAVRYRAGKKLVLISAAAYLRERWPMIELQ